MEPARLKILAKSPSGDAGVTKYALSLDDGNVIESVLMIDADGYTRTCISSQVACPVACQFCLSGQDKFVRNMTAEEIVAQVRTIESDTGRDVERVGFMGIGEPLLNYKEVTSAIALFREHSPKMYVALATVGIVPTFAKLVDDDRFALDALLVSLHAATDRTRKRLIPTKHCYGVDDILDVARRFRDARDIPVVLNYLLIAGETDTDEELEILIDKVAGGRFYVNLKIYNPIPNCDLSKSDDVRFDAFESALKQAGVVVSRGYSLGADVSGGCGQLRSVHTPAAVASA